MEEQQRLWEMFNTEDGNVSAPMTHNQGNPHRTESVASALGGHLYGHHVDVASVPSHAHTHGETPQPHRSREVPSVNTASVAASTEDALTGVGGESAGIIPSSDAARRAMIANNVVMPPRSAEALQTKTEEFVVIDSRDRNRNDHPEPCQYIINLGNEYRDVAELALISHCVPSPQHPVRESNSTLHYNTQDPIIQPANAGDDTLLTVTVETDDVGTKESFSIDYSATTQHTVSVPRGYYEDSAFDHATATTHGTATPLKQDALALSVEKGLEANSVDCVVTFQPQSLQYLLNSSYKSPFALPSEPYDTPLFLNLFFRGNDTFYGETTTISTNVSGDPNAPMYETTTVGKKQRNYLKNSIAPILGFPPTNPNQLLTGSVHSDSVDSRTLLGRGTRFTEELIAGDWIYVLNVADATKRFRLQILEVTSDTECTLVVLTDAGNNDVTPPTLVGASLAWRGRFVPPYVRNLSPDCYIILRIEQCETLESISDSINRAFVVLPTQNNDGFREKDPIIPIKRFNPTRGRLKQLRLSFHNPDGSLYDFLGQNHLLVFRLIRYKQNINYSHF